MRDGRRVFIYEQPATGDLFTITDPNLQLNQLEAVQRDVAALLEHGLNPPPVPAPATGEEAQAPAADSVPIDDPAPPDEPAPAAQRE